MSFLSPDDISKALLKDVLFLKNRGEVIFQKAGIPLLNYSLIDRLESSNYRLHRLVGLCVRKQIDSQHPQRRNELLEIDGFWLDMR